MPKIVKVDKKKYSLDDRVPSSEHIDINRMVELKYSLFEKLYWRFKNGRLRERFTSYFK